MICTILNISAWASDVKMGMNGTIYSANMSKFALSSTEGVRIIFKEMLIFKDFHSFLPMKNTENKTHGH